MSNENREPKYTFNRKEGDTIEQTGNFAVGVNKGKIKTEKLAGAIYEAQTKSLVEAAAEIHRLLQQLEQSYPTDTTTEQMVVATEVIKRIESDPDWTQRVVRALKEGGIQAFEKAIDHPVGAFVVGAIKGWQDK